MESGSPNTDRLLKTARIDAEWTTAPGADEILRRDEERLLADPMWDEAPTACKAIFSAVDMLLRDIMRCDLSFGGKGAQRDVRTIVFEQNFIYYC